MGSFFFVKNTSPLMRTTFTERRICMKKVSKVIYGLFVWYLIVFWGIYFGVVLYEGLQSVPDMSISGGWLFINGICTMGVLIVYPVKQFISEVIRNIKKDMDSKRKEKNRRKQTNTNK